ncbi:hypothetical protein Dimus_035854, partial [Dionaea muscipula]
HRADHKEAGRAHHHFQAQRALNSPISSFAASFINLELSPAQQAAKKKRNSSFQRTGHHADSYPTQLEADPAFTNSSLQQPNKHLM